MLLINNWVLSLVGMINLLYSSQHNCNTTKKELLAVVEGLNEFRGILFGYKINLFSYHKTMVDAATLSESQILMRWQLIIIEIGPNIQNIVVVDNIVADTLSRLPSASVNK